MSRPVVSAVDEALTASAAGNVWACAALYSKRQQGLVLALVAESDSSLSCASLDSLTEETLLGADS